MSLALNSNHSDSTRWELHDKNSRIEACLKGQPVAWLPTKKTDHYRQDISRADSKKMPALETLGPAKRKKHELQAESEDPETTGNEDREAASQGGEMEKPPTKKARRDNLDTGEGREADQACAQAGAAGRQHETSTEDLEQLKNPELKKCKRGRPPKSAVAIPVAASGSLPFNASVFVSIEQPPELVRGKTHRSDKHVAQEPCVAGPFTLVRLMKWAEFLDEVAECVGVDKENLQVNGLSWAFQKQKAQLPLTNEQAFKTLREQVKSKNGAATVIFVYHPICKKPQACAGQASQGAVVASEESTIWGKKVGHQINRHVLMDSQVSRKLSFSLASMTGLHPSLLSSKECMRSGDVQSTPIFTVLVLLSARMRPGTLNSTHHDYLYGPTQL